MGKAFVVEHRHLYVLCSLSTPTSAEGGVEEQGGREKLPVRTADKLNRLRVFWHGLVSLARWSHWRCSPLACSHNFRRCSFSGSIRYSRYGQLADFISPWRHRATPYYEGISLCYCNCFSWTVWRTDFKCQRHAHERCTVLGTLIDMQWACWMLQWRFNLW